MQDLSERKHKLRKLKKLEYKLRFGHAMNIAPDKLPRMIWDVYFDLSGAPVSRARYCLRQIDAMDQNTFKSVIDSYMADVYFRAYGISMNAKDYDPDALSMLGLPLDADEEMVKRRFRELAKQYHPDAGGDAAQFNTDERTV